MVAKIDSYNRESLRKPDVVNKTDDCKKRQGSKFTMKPYMQEK